MQESGPQHWLFQGNPKRYDLKEQLEPGTTELWVVTRYATRISAGDVVWFWRSGERALYGWGEVEEEPRSIDASKDIRVPVRYEQRFDPPIGLEDIRNDPVLSNMMVLRAPQGTNFIVTSDEAATLVKLIEENNYMSPSPIFGIGVPASLVLPSREAMQWLDQFSVQPALIEPVLQTVDLLAAIHDAAVYTKQEPSPFSTWLVKQLSGKQGSSSASMDTTLLDKLKESGDPRTDPALQDADVSDAVADPSEVSSLLLSQALAETVDRAAQIEARLAPVDDTDPALDIRTPALVAALLFSDWPPVKHLLARLDPGRTVATLRDAFLNEIKEVFGADGVSGWHPYTRLGAADLVVLNYAPDLAEGDDALNIKPDVQAFASVIASEKLTPPLSIGLFGDWGSGKSFFMRKLRDQVEELAKSARIPDPSEPGKLIENPESDFLPNIVQIEFNAWHYVESNLWASLVTHLFENLRIDSEDQEQVLRARRDSLINEMDTAAKLRAKAEDERDAAQNQLKKKRGQLRELQHTRSQQRIRRSFADIVSVIKDECYADLLSDNARDALEKAKAESGQLKDWNQALDALNQSAEDARSLFGRTGRIWRGLNQLGTSNWLWLGGLATAMLVLSICVPILIDTFEEHWEGTLGALVALVSGGAAWLHRSVQKASVALDWIESAQVKLNTVMAESVPPPSKQEKAIAEDLTSLESQIEIAETQVHQAAARAEAAEAELVDVERTASLAHFIEERAASGDYREQLGLLALIRQDFEQLSTRMRRTRRAPPALDDPSRIDRIVLYIDDLDRCPAERVFEVLQAIHLLLAFDLFVVVVGVDERWLMRALALARAGLLSRRGDGQTDTDKVLEGMNISLDDAARPADFLEKIFQMAFWLRPIDPEGFNRLLSGMLVRDQALLASAAGGALDTTATDEQGHGPAAPPVTGTGKPASSGQGEEAVLLGVGNEPDAANDITSARPEAVAITAKEAEVMRKLAPIVGRSPRTAKRFVNLFRVLKAREFVASALNPLRETETLGGMTLLALVAGNPRGTEALLLTIEEAPQELNASEFLVWTQNQNAESVMNERGVMVPREIAEVLEETARDYLSELQMADLQRWLPTVRRFSFRAEIARDASYVDSFSRTVPVQPTNSSPV